MGLEPGAKALGQAMGLEPGAKALGQAFLFRSAARCCPPRLRHGGYLTGAHPAQATKGAGP